MKQINLTYEGKYNYKRLYDIRSIEIDEGSFSKEHKLIFKNDKNEVISLEEKVNKVIFNNEYNANNLFRLFDKILEVIKLTKEKSIIIHIDDSKKDRLVEIEVI